MLHEAALFGDSLPHWRSGRPRGGAQDWPSRPITLIVPFAAGGGVDVSARIQAQGMSERLGQPIVVENMGGAGGMTGAFRVAKARARRLHFDDRQ